MSQPPEAPLDPALTARILEATRTVVADIGVRAATINAIAAAAGCNELAIHERWPDKNAHMAAALDGAISDEDVQERLFDAILATRILMMLPNGRFLAELTVLPSAQDAVSDGRSS